MIKSWDQIENNIDFYFNFWRKKNSFITTTEKKINPKKLTILHSKKILFKQKTKEKHYYWSKNKINTFTGEYSRNELHCEGARAS